ncbi:retrovirus-related pol polyprotein from transposon TNT 1-94 [Tanacetum coccineum]
MDDLIRNRNAKFTAFQQEIDTLKETLSNQVKEKESLSTTLTVFKIESKEKESKYIDKEIVLEKQNKELENIISIGYQNPFNLRKAQRIKPTLYDGSVIAKEEHVVIFVIDDEETLILEEESRSKMLDKQNDPISIKQKINISPIDYSKLNTIKKDFALKNELRKLKGKNIVDTAISKPSATIAPGMFKLDIEPISHSIKNNRDAHEVYLEKTIENTDTFRGLVECARKQNPSKPILDSACVITSTNEVPLQETTITPVITQSLALKEPKRSWGSTISDVPSSSLIDYRLSKLFRVRFGNDHIENIIGYGDYQMGNVTISQVYYVEGLALAKQGLVRGLPKLRYQKDHLCSACALGKRKKHSYKPKAEDSIQEKLYLLHMDLYGPMRIQSINGRNIYWLSLMIILDLHGTDNGTEFFNQTLRAYYEEVEISHQTSVARTPQQNGVAPLFLWAEAVAIACYTQNRSSIRKRHNKTPYELLHDRKPDLSYLHVFGALFYPTNDGEDLGKLKPKADIGIFVGYAPTKKAFRIYNKRTRMIIETIHVDFDELTAMASKQFSSGPEPKLLTPGTISSGLVVVQIVLWYLDSGCSKHMTENRSQLINVVGKFLGTVRFGNDHIAKIMGYGDYQMGNVTISQVYYVEGLGHNLFSVGQFCDSDLEVAFCKHTCFICDLEGVDLLKGSRGSNLYTLSMDNLLLSSPICLLSKALKTKSWLWHRRLSHLNFDYITALAKQGLV